MKLLLGVFAALAVLQFVLFYLCKKYKWKYADYLIFAFFLLGNFILFPFWFQQLFFDEASGTGCGIGDTALFLIFWIIGMPVTILLFIVFSYLRRKAK